MILTTVAIVVCILLIITVVVLLMRYNNLAALAAQSILYPARISFKYEGEIKSFTDKQKLREFSTTKPALQQMLRDLH